MTERRARRCARTARTVACLLVAACMAGCGSSAPDLGSSGPAGRSVTTDESPRPNPSLGPADTIDQLVPLLLDSGDVGPGYSVVYGPSGASSVTVSRVGDLTPGPMQVSPARCAGLLSDALLSVPENAVTVVLRPVEARRPDYQEVLLSRPEAGVLDALSVLVDSCPSYDVLVDGVPSPTTLREFDVPDLGDRSLGVLTTRTSPLGDYSWTSYTATVYSLVGPLLVAVEARVVRGDTGADDVTATDAQDAATAAAATAFDKVAGAT